MIISLVVAMAENRVIGKDNELPWHLPEDLKYFKRVTMGKPMVMGRKTYESIGKPLPGRENIIITRNPDYRAEGVHIVHSVREAVSLSERLTADSDVNEFTVIGGEEIFRLTLPVANRIHLTRVHASVEGDTWFPEFEESQWQEVSVEKHFADQRNPYDYSFTVLEKR